MEILENSSEKNLAFKFEYINHIKNPVKLLFVILMSFFTIMFFTIYLTIFFDNLYNNKNGIHYLTSVSFVGLASFGIFKLFTKNIKKFGSGILYDDFIEIQLETQIIKIKYYDIKEYKIMEDVNGINILINTTQGKKYVQASPSSFCDTSGLSIFTKEFEKKFNTFKKENLSLFIKEKYQEPIV